MIFFSGLGIITPLFAVIGVLAGSFASQALHLRDDGAGGVVIGSCVAAALCWWCGSALNNPAKDRRVIDKITGQEIRLKTRHTLMFIPMQYWAVAYLGLAALIGFSGP